ncbi:MAG TPA: ABC transporter permease [Ilumatobacteraceae bacterium]|nr:ABC transporter permease [Ilumatobacteraceae bacterium]HRB01724.1 ABC transporter permease [Ilumatobacteraceae bacterium]
MTITTTLPTNVRHTGVRPQPTTRTRRDDVAALPAALRSEWIKLRSLRSAPGILAGVVVIGVLLSWILATFVKTDPNTHLPFEIGQTFVFSTWLTMILAIVMGTLSFTSEVQHGTLATAVTTQPARWVIVAAKAVVGSGLGFAMGILGMAAGFSGAVLGGLKAGDTSGSLATAGWGLLLTTLAPMLGLGIGMIIRHGAAATTTVLIWALVIENITKSFAPANFTRLLPFSAAAGLLGIKTAGENAGTLAAALTRVQDAFVFSGYVALAIAIGTALLYRKDAS